MLSTVEENKEAKREHMTPTSCAASCLTDGTRDGQKEVETRKGKDRCLTEAEPGETEGKLSA